MKAWLAIVGILIVLLPVLGWLGGSWLIGGGIEQGFDEIVKHTNTSAAGAMTIKKGDYQRGLLSSDIKSRLTFFSAQAGGPDQTAILKHRILHGPLIFSPEGLKIGSAYSITTLDLSTFSDEERAVIEEGLAGEEELITVTSFSSFGGATDFHLSIPPFRAEMSEDGEKFLIDLSGVEGRLDGGPGGTSYTGDLDLGFMKVQNDAERLTITLEDGEGVVDARRIEDGLMLDGESRLTLPRILIRSEGKKFEIRNVEMTAQAREESGNLNSSIKLSYGGVSGPATAEGGAWLEVLEAGGSFEAGIHGLDVELLRKVDAQQAEVQEAFTAAEKTGMTPGQEKLVEEFANNLLAMLKPGIGLSYKLVMGDGDNLSESSFTLTYKGSTPLLETGTMREAIEALDGETEHRLSKNLISPEMAEALLAPMIEGGMIRASETHFEARGSLGDGVIKVNGQEEMPLLDGLGPMLDAPVEWDEFAAGMMTGMPDAAGGPGVPPEAGMPSQEPGDTGEPVTPNMEAPAGEAPEPGEPAMPGESPVPDPPDSSTEPAMPGAP